MKPLALLALLLLAACSSGPATFSKPAHAQAWDLNPGRWPGTNDLIHEPIGSR